MKIKQLTNSLSHETGSDCTVDTTGNGTNDLGLGANELANALNLVLDEVTHDPVLSGTADIDGEVLEKLNTAGSVLDLGVELDAEDGLGLVGNAGKLRVRSAGKDGEALGKLDQLVEVAHVDCLNSSQ